MLSRRTGRACRYAQKPAGSIVCTAGAPVRTECSSAVRLPHTAGRPNMLAKARIDIG